MNICCSLYICMPFLTVEKFISAMIKRPAIIATEMNGIYVKNESMSFSCCAGSDISFFYM
jgi:hypothetical protein